MKNRVNLPAKIFVVTLMAMCFLCGCGSEPTTPATNSTRERNYAASLLVAPDALGKEWAEIDRAIIVATPDHEVQRFAEGKGVVPFFEQHAKTLLVPHGPCRMCAGVAYSTSKPGKQIPDIALTAVYLFDQSHVLKLGPKDKLPDGKDWTRGEDGIARAEELLDAEVLATSVSANGLMQDEKGSHASRKGKSIYLAASGVTVEIRADGSIKPKKLAKAEKVIRSHLAAKIKQEEERRAGRTETVAVSVDGDVEDLEQFTHPLTDKVWKMLDVATGTVYRGKFDGKGHEEPEAPSAVDNPSDESAESTDGDGGSEAMEPTEE